MNKSVFFAAVLFLVSMVAGAGTAHAAGYSADFSLRQHEVSTCPAGGGQLIFAEITNTGTDPDSYWISASKDWVVMPEIYLEPGEFSLVGILVAIGDPTVVPGKHSVDLTIHSSRSKNTYQEKITVKTLDCPGIVMQPKADMFFGCTKDEVSAPILVRNPGNIKDTFELSATKGTMSNATVTLESGEEKEIYVTLLPSEGQQDDVFVSASSKVSYAKSSAKVSFVGRNCYSASVSLAPAYIKACKEDGVAFAVKIANTGEKADTYSVASNAGNLSASEIEVAPNVTATSILTVTPESAGTQEVTVEITSANTKQSAKAELESEECYVFGVSIVPEKLLSENYSGIISSIVLNNRGLRQDKYSIALEGTPWMEVAPEEITVEPNTTKKAYIYVTPVFGIANGTYTANVVVTSEKSKAQATKQFEFSFGNVSPEGVPPITGAVTKTISKKVVYSLIIGLAVVLLLLFGREFKRMSKEEEKTEEKGESKDSDKKQPEKKEKKRGRPKKEKEVKDDIKDILEGI